MFISICISTYKRPHYLKNLLEKINDLNIPVNVQVAVNIADNDLNKSGEKVVEEVRSYMKFSIAYEVETTKGISYSRNKTVSMVDSRTDFIAFIDDDEYPDKDWLYNLIQIQELTNADLVEGIAIMDFVEKPPKWVLDSEVLLIPHYKKLSDGQDLPFNAVITNNLLVRYSLISKLDGPFDVKLALTGGEDTDLGIRLHEIGCKMVFTNRAVVYEFVPPERTSFKWIMQRGYSSANALWRLHKDKNLVSFITFFVKGILRILLAFILIIPSLFISLFLGYHYFFKIIRIFVRGVAILADMLGFHYQEYKHSYTTGLKS